MKKIVTLGELLLRLSAPGHERFFQSPNFEATFSGSEANIACELAQLGNRASYVTAVPDNAIGEAALSEVRKYDVDLSTVIRKDGRIGIYFLETGAYRRPSNVVYDRENSCIAKALPSDFDWEAVFADASWFHISGITPAVSENAYRTTIEAIAQAKKRNITVSFDINYRAKLWRYGRRAEDAVKEIVKSADILITNEGHIRFCLGITVPGYDTSREGLPDEYFEKISIAVKREYPNIHTVALTRRRTYTSDVNDFSALLHDKNGTFFVSKNITSKISSIESEGEMRLRRDSYTVFITSKTRSTPSTSRRRPQALSTRSPATSRFSEKENWKRSSEMKRREASSAETIRRFYLHGRERTLCTRSTN